MDTVTIDGVEYVKASVLAKRYKYTADYIGQLCRARKVDAHLVGRTWYVYPPTLEGHKTTRYAELRSGEKMIHNNISKPKQVVPPPVPRESAKTTTTPNFINRVLWRAPAYEADEADLLPELGKKTTTDPIKMKIGLADSEKVNVAAVSKNVTMVSQPLPAVALSGTLKVLDYEPHIIVAEEKEYLANASDSEESSAVPLVESTGTQERQLHPTHVVGAKVKVKIHRSTLVSQLSAPATPPTATKPLASVTTHHLAVQETSDLQKPVVASRKTTAAPMPALETNAVAAKTVPLLRLDTVSKAAPSNPPASSPFFRLVIAPAVLLVALLSAAALLSLESVTEVGDGGKNHSTLRLQATTFDALIALVKNR